MRLEKYIAVEGQSLYDVCLNTYGTLDLLRRLMDDSGVDNVNHLPFSGQVFLFDPELVVDQALQRSQVVTETRYATAVNKLGGNYYSVIDNGVIGAPTGGGSPYTPPTNPNEVTYEKQLTASDQYTAGADGEAVINLTAWIGWDVLQIEREIMPLKDNQFAWNKISGTLTLTSDAAMEAGQSLFLLFTKTVTITQ